jgi:hypothetical protein
MIIQLLVYLSIFKVGDMSVLDRRPFSRRKKAGKRQYYTAGRIFGSERGE